MVSTLEQALIDLLTELGYTVTPPQVDEVEPTLPPENATIDEIAEFIERNSFWLESDARRPRELARRDFWAYDRAFQRVNFDRMFSHWTPEQLLSYHDGGWHIAPSAAVYNAPLNRARERARKAALGETPTPAGHGMGEDGRQR